MKYVTLHAPSHPWAGRYQNSRVSSVPPGDLVLEVSSSQARNWRGCSHGETEASKFDLPACSTVPQLRYRVPRMNYNKSLGSEA
jgi:hypothetical protein